MRLRPIRERTLRRTPGRSSSTLSTHGNPCAPVAAHRDTVAPAAPFQLNIPDDARRRAAELVGTPTIGAPLVGIQPATGRRIKEWDPARFAELGAEIARTRGASVVLIGSAADKPVLDAVRAAWPSDVPLAEFPPDVDLVVLAAVLERLALFITGDTGPMHLAAAVGTPVLAIFGPSLPTRYAPLSPRSRIVRIDIHCSPCNLMRQPPTRCSATCPIASPASPQPTCFAPQTKCWTRHDVATGHRHCHLRRDWRRSCLRSRRLSKGFRPRPG